MNHILQTALETVRTRWRQPAWRRSTLVTALAAVSAAIAAPHMFTVEPEVLPSAIIEATERVGEIPVEVATKTAATTPGRHMGFDTNVYPGDKAMRAWKESAEYEWVGYYLPAPCHKDGTWAGKRERLVEMGWGMAVIYVGQQTWGRTPRPGSKAADRALRSGASCNADLVSTQRGTIDGDDAVAKASADGFPRGTVIFLDIERMERMPQAMRDYYKAWAARVLTDGRYRVGVYVHAHNAEDVHGDLKQAFADVGNTEEPTIWVASGHNFSRDKAPADVGHTFAGVWQGMLDIVESNGGIKLPIDVNVAAVPSPSDQYAITAD